MRTHLTLTRMCSLNLANKRFKIRQTTYIVITAPPDFCLLKQEYWAAASTSWPKQATV